VVSRGVLHALNAYPALVAWDGDTPLGFAVYRLDQEGCELLAIHALAQWRGTGSALLHAVEVIAARAACSRVWLCTTNDNLSALRFYQRRGYRLRELAPGAFDEVRRLKRLPQAGDIPGNHGIAIRDELVLEKSLR